MSNPYDTAIETPMTGMDREYDPANSFRPVEPGSYEATVEMADPDRDTRWSERNFNGKYYTADTLVTLDNGRKVYGRVNTRVRDNGGTSAQDIIFAANRASLLQDVDTHEAMCRAVDESLEGGARMRVVIRWEAPFKDAATGQVDYNDSLRDIELFPLNDKGVRTHIVKKLDDSGELIGTYTAKASAAFYNAL